MAHEIEELDGAAYAAEAWHGLGVVFDRTMTRQEAEKASKLNWSVEKEPCVHQVVGPDGEPITHEIPERFWTVRTDLPVTDTRRYLGCVGPRYFPIQNHELFDMAEALHGEGGACFESAFSMRNGKLVAILMQMPESTQVLDDTIGRYLLVTSSHDGSNAWEGLITSVRVVCKNTLDMAMHGAKNRIRIKHTANAKGRIDEARKVLLEADKFYNVQAETFTSMAQKRVNREFAEAYIEKLFPIKPGQKRTGRAEKARARVAELFAGAQLGGNQQAVKGTRYGLLQAVVEYTDHNRTVRVAKGRDPLEARADSILYGSASSFKNSAFSMLANVDEELAELVGSN